MLSDLNSTRMLLLWEVMTSGISEPQNLPCSLASGDRPLRTSTKSYLQTCKGVPWGAPWYSHGSAPDSLQEPLPYSHSLPSGQTGSARSSGPLDSYWDPSGPKCRHGALMPSTLAGAGLYLGLG